MRWWRCSGCPAPASPPCCGTSTGCSDPTSGAVNVLGTDVGRAGGARAAALRRRVGFVFQQFHLVGRLRVLENVCTGALGRLRGPRLGLLTYPRALRRALGSWTGSGCRQGVPAGGHAVGRPAAAGRRGARADAAPGDPAGRRTRRLAGPGVAAQVMRLIREISPERRLTVLCSLHQVDLALCWADRIIGLREGRVVLDIPVAGLEPRRGDGVVLQGRRGADARHRGRVTMVDAAAAAAHAGPGHGRWPPRRLAGDRRAGRAWAAGRSPS